MNRAFVAILAASGAALLARALLERVAPAIGSVVALSILGASLLGAARWARSGSGRGPRPQGACGGSSGP